MGHIDPMFLNLNSFWRKEDADAYFDWDGLYNYQVYVFAVLS
jgi:hypothetical protein